LIKLLLMQNRLLYWFIQHIINHLHIPVGTTRGGEKLEVGSTIWFLQQPSLDPANMREYKLKKRLRFNFPICQRTKRKLLCVNSLVAPAPLLRQWSE